jgi:hypothetical protein
MLVTSVLVGTVHDVLPPTIRRQVKEKPSRQQMKTPEDADSEFFKS